jgi:hypothetical protein
MSKAETRVEGRIRVLNLGTNASFLTTGSGGVSKTDCWRFGSDNLFPQAIAMLNRRSTVHRGILKNKAFYIAGRGFAADEKVKLLQDLIKVANAYKESLRDVIKKIVFDKKSFGNAYLEVVTNQQGSFVNLYHQDATKCRLSKDKSRIFLHHNWKQAQPGDKATKNIPLYPVFEPGDDGYLHSCIHLKEYEPEFENYGLMDWVAGLSVSAIAYKTDKWNISRLNNSFNSSGVLLIGGQFETPEDVKEFNEEFDNKFIGEGNQGKLLRILQKPGQDPDTMTRFIPLSQNAEGDWKGLHDQSTADLITAHNWYRSLSGLSDNTGFDTKRVLNEYEIALNTVILDEQTIILEKLKEVIEFVTRTDSSSLTIINKPPMTEKPAYMRIWEARKIDGLAYDETDPTQQDYLANISKATVIQIPAAK